MICVFINLNFNDGGTRKKQKRYIHGQSKATAFYVCYNFIKNNNNKFNTHDKRILLELKQKRFRIYLLWKHLLLCMNPHHANLNSFKYENLDNMENKFGEITN